MFNLSVLVELIAKGWNYVSASRWFWSVLKNWYWIKDSIQKIEGILIELQKTKSLPDQAQIKILIKLTREALDLGLIDLPNVNEATLSFELQKLEESLISKTQKIERS